MVGHGNVDLPRQLDEASVEVPLFRFPREVERIHRDAVPAQTRPGLEGLKAKGFRRGSVNNFPDVNSHAQAQELELIHQGDVHAAIDVFKQLRHFRRGGRGDRHNVPENGSI